MRPGVGWSRQHLFLRERSQSREPLALDQAEEADLDALVLDDCGAKHLAASERLSRGLEVGIRH